MILQNKSKRPEPIQAVKPLLRFVQSFCAYIDMARLRIEDAEGYITSGLAAKTDLGSDCLISPSLVTIWVCSANAKVYPFRTAYVPEVGVVRLDSWEEELLFVLAHELAHVESFWSTSIPSDLTEHEEEVRAERFAVNILNQWRKS